MNIMIDPYTNEEEVVYLRKEGIDRGVGYLVVGVVVLLLFLLTILGMGRIHSRTDSAVSSNRYQSAPDNASEIGGTDSSVR